MMSSKRMYQIDAADNSLVVEMTGAANERIVMSYLIDGHLASSDCDFGPWTRVVLDVLKGSCVRG